LGPYFLYKNLYIRSFIYSEINTFRLSKFSKISFAFNIFIPIPVQEKAIQENYPNGRFCVGNHRSKNVYEKIWGVSAPLAPLGSAYGLAVGTTIMETFINLT